MISFIIPAHNEETMLPKTLESVHLSAKNLGTDYEVIVVSDSSSDQTEGVARTHGARVLSVQNKQIAATRNHGAKEALGDILIFLDADTHLSEKTVKSALKELKAGALGGGCAIRLHGRPKAIERALVWVFSWLFFVTKIAPGCFVYSKKDAFFSVGGFNETLFAAEDVQFSQDLAKRGKFVILREWVSTSDRKMRTHGAAAHLKLFWQLMRRGRGALRDRKDLDLWYGERKDPS